MCTLHWMLHTNWGKMWTMNTWPVTKNLNTWFYNGLKHLVPAITCIGWISFSIEGACQPPFQNFLTCNYWSYHLPEVVHTISQTFFLGANEILWISTTIVLGWKIIGDLEPCSLDFFSNIHKLASLKLTAKASNAPNNIGRNPKGRKQSPKYHFSELLLWVSGSRSTDLIERFPNY